MSPHRLMRALERQVGSRTVAWIIIFVAINLVATVMIGVGGWVRVGNEADANRQTAAQLVQAVCTLRADYTKRINDTQAFLDRNPGGLDLPGENDITAAQLRLNILNMERTRAALTSVDCQHVEPLKFLPALQPTDG